MLLLVVVVVVITIVKFENGLLTYNLIRNNFNLHNFRANFDHSFLGAENR